MAELTVDLLKKTAQKLKQQTGQDAMYLHLPNIKEALQAGCGFGFVPFCPLPEDMNTDDTVWMIRNG